MNVFKQIKQFFKPFPEKGSIAYNLKVRAFDKQTGGPVKSDLNIDPEDNNGAKHHLDIPAYLRRGTSPKPGTTAYDGGNENDRHHNANGGSPRSGDGV